jgi:hypothetical protein
MSYDEMAQLVRSLEGRELMLPSGESLRLTLKHLLSLAKEVNKRGEVIYELNIGLRGLGGGLLRLTRRGEVWVVLERRLRAH